MARNPPGPAVDAQGQPVIDPTANVIANLAEAVKRLDDLREMNNRRIDDGLTNVREMSSLRAQYDEKLREAETKRIDAIRAVDVGAVNRAAEVSAAQALTLATQVATSAETLRAQVATTAEANRVALATALNPVLESIADLRRIQYEQQGQKISVAESRDERQDKRQGTNTITNVITAFIIAAGAIVTVLIAKGG